MRHKQVKAQLTWSLLLLGLHLLLSSHPLPAQFQVPALDWAYAAGQDSNCNGNALCTDAAGNAYAVCFFQGAIDADPGPATANFNAANGTAMLQKVSPSGSLLWAKQYGNNGTKTGTNAIALDASNNIYIAGAFDGPTDFDPGPAVHNRTPLGQWDAYVLKLDSNGNFLWVATMGSPAGTDWAYALAVDGMGNVYATGELGGAADFDPGSGAHILMPAGTRGAFVWKLLANGSLGWAGMIDGPGTALGRGIAVDGSGDVLWCGYFTGALDFDPGIGTILHASAGQEDGFLQKLTPNGNLLWTQYYGGDSSDHVENVRIGPQNGIYLTGNFRDTVDFDASPATYNLAYTLSQTAFACKLDSNGSLRWVRNIPQSTPAEGLTTQVDGDGAVYFQGYCWGTLDFDPAPASQYTLSAAGSSDGFVVKMDSSGDFEWAGLLSGPTTENFHALALDGGGNLWLTGNISATTDFEPGTGNYTLGLADGHYFLAKWQPCIPPTLVVTDTACTFFTTHGQTFQQNGHYQLRIPNQGGCDSLLDLHLTFTYQETHVFSTFCTPDTINGLIYTYPGTFVQVTQSVQQCDSVIYYHLVGNPYYRYLTPVIACGQYTYRNIIHLGSGTYYYPLSGPSTGCDTVEVLQLTLYHDSGTILNVNSCGPYTLNDSTYSASGTYSQTLNNTQGCDSVLTLNLNIPAATAFTLVDTACSTYSLNGQTYTTGGLHIQTLVNAQGCDSILTLDLTLNSSITDIYQDACDSFTLNGITYTATGHYTQSFTNAAGCDSILHLYLTLHPPSSEAMQVATCQSYTLNGQTYVSSGTYTQYLTNAAGCDSILTLFLTIWPNTSAFLITSTCDSFALNGATYYGSGVYTQSLVNSHGCDSLLHLYLTIDTINLQVTQSGNNLAAQQSGANYQWLLHCDSVPAVLSGATGQSLLAPFNGYYAVVIGYNSCQDTSDCMQVTGVGLDARLGMWRVYPNPSDDGVWVEGFEGLMLGEIVVSDALGRVVLVLPGRDLGRQYVNLSGFPAGVYHLRMGEFRQRIVLQR